MNLKGQRSGGCISPTIGLMVVTELWVGVSLLEDTLVWYVLNGNHKENPPIVGSRMNLAGELVSLAARVHKLVS